MHRPDSYTGWYQFSPFLFVTLRKREVQLGIVPIRSDCFCCPGPDPSGPRTANISLRIGHRRRKNNNQPPVFQSTRHIIQVISPTHFGNPHRKTISPASRQNNQSPYPSVYILYASLTNLTPHTLIFNQLHTGIISATNIDFRLPKT